MVLQINYEVALFCSYNKSKAYIFNISSNEMQETSIEMVKYIKDIVKKEESFSKEEQEIVKYLKGSGLLIEKIETNEITTNVLNTMFNSKLKKLDEIINNDMREKFVFLGFPYEQSITNLPGTKFATKKLRENSNVIYNCQDNYKSYSYDCSILDDKMYDLGDIKGVVFDRNGKQFDFLSNIIFTLTETNNIPIVLGGDHSISYSTISGASRDRKIGVIHIDAHDDYYEISSENWRKELHHGNYLGGLTTNENIEKIYIIGVRALSPFLAEHPKIKIYPEDSFKKGLELDESLDYYLSVDIDVIDPLIVKGIGNPVPLGLSVIDIVNLIKNICSKVSILGVDFVEFIPNDHNEILTIDSIIFETIKSILKVVQSSVLKTDIKN